MVKMKSWIFRLGFVFCLLCPLLYSCERQAGKGGEKQISPDVVDNPQTASGKTDPAKMPVMTFENDEHDFGNIMEGETVTCNFKFKNSGKSDLVISKVSTSCGCTASEYPTEAVKPGESKAITVTFKSEGKRGFQSKQITVLANTDPNMKVLRIKAMVLEPGENDKD
jgi:hypothetical protein